MFVRRLWKAIVLGTWGIIKPLWGHWRLLGDGLDWAWSVIEGWGDGGWRLLDTWRRALFGHCLRELVRNWFLLPRWNISQVHSCSTWTCHIFVNWLLGILCFLGLGFLLLIEFMLKLLAACLLRCGWLLLLRIIFNQISQLLLLLLLEIVFLSVLRRLLHHLLSSGDFVK